METFPNIRNEPKRTISTNCGLGLLQMISEIDIRRCANEDAGPQGVETLPTRDVLKL